MKIRKYISQRLLVIFIAIIGIATIVLTIEFSREGNIPFLVDQKDRLLAAEIAFFGIIIVEILSRMAIKQFRQREAVQMGVAVRGTLRTVSYLVIAIVVVSILSANPTLAVSVGAITGIVIGLAAQNIIGNVVAGTILAIMRPIRISDEITIMGNTGIVIEIGVMHTIVDSGERWVLVPNMAMLTNAVRRKKGDTGS
jgi:small conductance mechanosensitive channel